MSKVLFLQEIALFIVFILKQIPGYYFNAKKINYWFSIVWRIDLWFMCIVCLFALSKSVKIILYNEPLIAEIMG